MHPFSTPWKHLTVTWCFQGVEKGCIGKEWVKLATINLITEKNIRPGTAEQTLHKNEVFC